MLHFNIRSLLMLTFVFAASIVLGDQLFDQLLAAQCLVGVFGGTLTRLPPRRATVRGLLSSLGRCAWGGCELAVVAGPVLLAIASHRSGVFTWNDLVGLKSSEIRYEVITCLCVGILMGAVVGGIGGTMVGLIRSMWGKRPVDGDHRPAQPTGRRRPHRLRLVVFCLIVAIPFVWIATKTATYLSALALFSRLGDRVDYSWRYDGPQWLFPLVEESYDIRVFRRLRMIEVRDALTTREWRSLGRFRDLEYATVDLRDLSPEHVDVACQTILQWSVGFLNLKTSTPGLTLRHLERLSSVRLNSLALEGSGLSAKVFKRLKDASSLYHLSVDIDQLKGGGLDALLKMSSLHIVTLNGKGIEDRHLLQVARKRLGVRLRDTAITSAGLEKARALGANILNW